MSMMEWEMGTFFQLFPYLPIELRKVIHDFSIEPQTVIIKNTSWESYRATGQDSQRRALVPHYKMIVTSNAHFAAPPQLSVSREFRIWAKKQFLPCFKSQIGRNIYFNYERDMLLMDGNNSFLAFFGGPSGGPGSFKYFNRDMKEVVDHVKHIAISGKQACTIPVAMILNRLPNLETLTLENDEEGPLYATKQWKASAVVGLMEDMAETEDEEGNSREAIHKIYFVPWDESRWVDWVYEGYRNTTHWDTGIHSYEREYYNGTVVGRNPWTGRSIVKRSEKKGLDFKNPLIPQSGRLRGVDWRIEDGLPPTPENEPLLGTFDED